MTLTLEIAPEVEAALTAQAQQAGTSLPDYVAARLTELAEADSLEPNDLNPNGLEEIAALYEQSLAEGNELTAATSAPSDLHEYSAEELAAMENGEFEQPLRRAA
jgi:hypothetical protein